MEKHKHNSEEKDKDMHKEQKKTEEQKRNEKEKQEKQIAELTDTLKRLQAEFENFKKRTLKEQQEFSRYCASQALSEFLPVLDSFESALEKAGKEEKKAIEPLYTQLKKVLEKNGIKAFESRGKEFNPALHEIMLTGNENDKEEGIVLEELQKGYLLHDKVLRHAKVKANQKPGGTEDEGKQKDTNSEEKEKQN